jgi:hypothetical protein
VLKYKPELVNPFSFKSNSSYGPDFGALDKVGLLSLLTVLSYSLVHVFHAHHPSSA